jgi:hypothetical protein
MDVILKVCSRCGMTHEIITRRFGDYRPICPSCQEPLQEPKRVSSTGAGNGFLQLRMVPGRGLGVFTQKDILQDTIVERCPVFVLSAPPEAMLNTVALPYSESDKGISLRHLLFPWMKNDIRAFALGYAMLYNHEPVGTSNLMYRPHVHPETNRRFIDFFSKREIKAGEELTQTYAASNRLWFGYKRGTNE